MATNETGLTTRVSMEENKHIILEHLFINYCSSAGLRPAGGPRTKRAETGKRAKNKNNTNWSHKTTQN